MLPKQKSAKNGNSAIQYAIDVIGSLDLKFDVDSEFKVESGRFL